MAIKAYEGNYTWEEARIKCSEDGTDVKAELPAPQSKIENWWYGDMAVGNGINKFWLGINDRDVEGEYNNQHGSPHTFFEWGFLKPEGDDMFTERDCVQHHGISWSDAECSVTNSILCTHVEGKAVIAIKVQSKRIVGYRGCTHCGQLFFR